MALRFHQIPAPVRAKMQGRPSEDLHKAWSNHGKIIHIGILKMIIWVQETQENMNTFNVRHTYLFQLPSAKKLLCCHTPMQTKKTRPCQDYHLQQKMSDVRLGRRKNHGNLRIRCDVWNFDSLDITLCTAKHWYAQVLLAASKSRFETNLKAIPKWFNMTWIPCFAGIPALAFSHSSILQQKVPGCPNQCSCSLIATLPQNGATFKRETWPTVGGD